MYNNIDTPHAIQVISWWLDELEPDLPPGYPIEAVKYAMRLVMENNVFEFGTQHYIQLLGTAMGTSAAVMWATLYFGYHEAHLLLPTYSQQLFYYRRFIDDIFAIWLIEDGTSWTDFKHDINDFGVLTWETEEPSTSVNFLDMTLTIVEDRIEFRTYQKDMNLYLYLPPTSAHPGGCIKGTIYGLIGRYFAQNTHRKDYLKFVGLLYSRLLNRGWEQSYIKPLILEACSTIESRDWNPTPTNATDATSDNNMLFIHVQYQLYDHHLGELIQSELDIERPTIAYSRPPNIGEYVAQTTLHEAPGRTSDFYMGEYRQGLNL